jgi:N-acetylglucosaminyldiphosphoundecaprenol N-acetyl-beta-D-mannosaminyltransferase
MIVQEPPLAIAAPHWPGVHKTMRSIGKRLIVDENTANFLGLGVRALTYDDFFKKIDSWLSGKNGRSYHVALINAFCAVSNLSDPRLAKIYNGADLICPDGMPFVYWIRTFLKKPCQQFDASSILTNLIKRSSSSGYTFYLYGGHPEVLEKMKRNLERTYPHIKIVGHQSPPFRALTEQEDRAVCEEINRTKPDILCIGLGTPKQDYWIDDHIYKIRGTVMVPCGAIFDFFGGRIKRAPSYVRRAGIEWLYRLFSKDFKRLFRRYTIMNIVFIINLFLQVMGLRVRNPRPWKRS